jgi:hypothetical protein
MPGFGKNALDDASLFTGGKSEGVILHSSLVVTGTISYAGSASTVTLNGASVVTVADASVTAHSVILFTLKTVGGTVGAAPVVDTITPGTGFTVKGTASDTSIYNYRVL